MQTSLVGAHRSPVQLLGLRHCRNRPSGSLQSSKWVSEPPRGRNIAHLRALVSNSSQLDADLDLILFGIAKHNPGGDKSSFTTQSDHYINPSVQVVSWNSTSLEPLQTLTWRSDANSTVKMPGDKLDLSPSGSY